MGFILSFLLIAIFLIVIKLSINYYFTIDDIKYEDDYGTWR